MMVMINATMNEINNNKNLFHILKSKKDFENISNEKLNVLMGIEGLELLEKILIGWILFIILDLGWQLLLGMKKMN